MALITCPECGRQVSTAASTCPHCGYPLSSAIGAVNITTPAYIEGKRQGLFAKPGWCSIWGNGVNWSGPLGSVAHFEITEPIEICIDLDRDAVFFTTVVAPNTNYRLAFVGVWGGLAKYQLQVV